jgi:hypothetical protein
MEAAARLTADGLTSGRADSTTANASVWRLPISVRWVHYQKPIPQHRVYRALQTTTYEVQVYMYNGPG